MLGPEHSCFYEPLPSAMRGTHTPVQQNQPPTYPRYARYACILGFVSRETPDGVFFPQHLAPIFNPLGQPGYGDKRTS